jgi:uncharacterized protein (UPF0276 family)
VQQIHLAGHSEAGGYLFDDHGSPVSAAVWRMYQESFELFGVLPTIIEWDERLPELSVLEAEAAHARALSNARRANQRESLP